MFVRPSARRAGQACFRLLVATSPALGGCSPNLGLLDSQTSFGGAGDELGDGRAGGGAGGGDQTAGMANGTAASGAGRGDQTAGGAEPALGAAGEMSVAGAAGAGGAGGAAAVVEPCVAHGSEQCNGRDDDCNGVVDDGCPGAVTTTFVSDLALLGDSAGGSAFADDCKDGEVLGGISVAMGAFLSQVRGVCRKLSLDLQAGAAHGYAVKLSHDRELAAHPQSGPETLAPLACPENEALVGLRLAQQHYGVNDGKSVPVTTRVWLTCAKLVLDEVDGKLSVTWTGARELAPASGSMADGTAWLVSSSAPARQVASRLLGASGSWVDRIGFGVSKLGVSFN
jgi:hypothetical protein